MNELRLPILSKTYNVFSVFLAISMVLMTVGVALSSRNYVVDTAHQYFKLRTNEIRADVANAVNAHNQLLDVTSVYYSLHTEDRIIDSQLFTESLGLQENYPGVLAIGFAQTIDQANLAEELTKIDNELSTISPDHQLDLHADSNSPYDRLTIITKIAPSSTASLSLLGLKLNTALNLDPSFFENLDSNQGVLTQSIKTADGQKAIFLIKQVPGENNQGNFGFVLLNQRDMYESMYLRATQTNSLSAQITNIERPHIKFAEQPPRDWDFYEQFNFSLGGEMHTMEVTGLQDYTFAPGYRFIPAIGTITVGALSILVLVFTSWISRSQDLLISQTSQQAEELAEATAELNAIITNSSLPVAIRSKEGVFRVVNKAYAKHIDRKPADLIEKDYRNVLPPQLVESTREHDAQVFSQKKEVIKEHQFENAQGETKTYLVNKLPLVRDGQVYAIATIATDISTQKAYTLEMKERQQELERLNKLMVNRELKMVELKQEIARLKLNSNG